MTTHDQPAGVTHLPLARSRTLSWFTRGCGALLAVLLCASCSTGRKPDADWNSMRLWHMVAQEPPTYVPTGYAADQPRTERDGTWFTDSRDGKRLFVPKQGVRGLQPGVLTGEAKKATGFDGKPRLTAGEKVWWGTTALFGAMAGVEVPPPD